MTILLFLTESRVKSQETGADIWIPLVEKFSAQITTLHLQSRPIRVAAQVKC